MLELINIGKNFYLGEQKQVVLDNICLNVGIGESVAITGPSGSGKSTLMHILGGLERPTSGKYFYQNTEIHSLNNKKLASFRNQKVGFIFQQFHLIEKFTALENVLLPAQYYNIYQPFKKRTNKTLLHEKAEELLASVGLANHMKKQPAELSGGMQQRVAIARALINEPDLILADEPTGALDTKTGGEILNLLLDISSAGKSVVIVTHDSNVAKQCQRQLVLVDGKLV